ncbi:MAG: hypothetical protein CM15mP4_2890 [Candidatus Neomarinimicrobiota bacterium]|nr:MAG: hypothetical protein CM15mP4_2890 [Candidatus Neomarinimicrobiota bacterium]
MARVSKKRVKSEIADVKNIGQQDRQVPLGGGAFLKKFVGDNIPWVHFDIAGTAWGNEPNSFKQRERNWLGYKGFLGYDEKF